MNKRLLHLTVLFVFQLLLAVPVFAGEDSTKVEVKIPIGFDKELIKDDIDLLLLLEYGAIWDPLSLENPSEEGEFTGVLTGGSLYLPETVSGSSYQLEVYRGLLPVFRKKVTVESGDAAGIPLGTLSVGRYTVLMISEEEDGVCYVGRFVIE